MTETRVTILDVQEGEDRELTIRINTGKPNFVIKSDRLEANFLRSIDDRMSDFIDIARSIFAADRRIGRGGNLRSGFGQRWRRRLRFRFEVRDPAYWRMPEITNALRNAVRIMSDDIVELDFEAAKHLPHVRGMLKFDQECPIFPAEDVILFSGGLDSLAGAYDRLSSGTGKVILLTHFSANKRMKYPKILVDELKKRFPDRILWVPVSAHLKGVKAKESTQRTRSLLFACLGFVTARLAGAKRLHFYENGIVSANLPISAQVIGTMASRTTHPQTIAALGALLEVLAPGQIQLASPYCGLTKTQVAGRLAELGGADLIRHTVSCSHVREQTILPPHCGACSQCLDRRFGILAAGLADHDPNEGYVIDVLTGARPTDASRILALDWTRHALRLAGISDGEFLSEFGSELSRLVEARPDLPAASHAREVVAMHRVHGEGVRRVLASALSENSDTLLEQRLPDSSLLRMVVAEQAAIPDHVPKIAKVDAPSGAPQAWSSSIYPLKVRISGSATNAHVIISDLGEVSGVNATPAWALNRWQLEDRSSNLELSEFRFFPGGELAGALNMTKHVVRQRIKRLRDEFAEQYEAIEGKPPSEPILIHSQGSRDYRIGPECELLDNAMPDAGPA